MSKVPTINHPLAERASAWLKRHPWLAASLVLLGFFLKDLPEWIAAIWSLRSSKPFLVALEEKMQGFRFPHFSVYWIGDAVGWALLVGIFYLLLIGRRSAHEQSQIGTERETKTGTRADAYTDEWLREVLQSDRESIARLVKVFIVDWKPEFSTHVLRPYIDFWFAISNISICAVRFEEKIGGYITFQKEGAVKRSEFREKPVLAPDKELDVLPKKPGLLVIRQWLDRAEADEINTSGSKSKFWLHELQVYFYGEGINRTRLWTSRVLEKNKRWTADPGLYFAFDDHQLAEADAIVKSPLPDTTKPKSLHDFFLMDCKGDNILSTHTLTGNDANKTRYELEYLVCLDFDSKTFRVSYFLPKSDFTFLVCQKLPSTHEKVVEDTLRGDKRHFMEGAINHPPGEKEERWAELKPSDRVRVYYETHLLDGQIKELESLYQKEGLSPQFRGPHWLVMRTSPLYEPEN